MKIQLLGRKLTHSLSPELHKLFADYSYTLMEVEPENLDSFFEKGDFDGLNVTIPYKKEVMKYCDILTPEAKKIGAVNTIYRDNEGNLIGHNTDYDGFSAMVDSVGIDVNSKKVIILGSGGASLTAQKVCEDRGAREIFVISRSGENNYNNLYEKHFDADILINCTPVGMYPNLNESVVELRHFTSLKAVFDMIYNPYRTRLLLDAENLNIPYCGGLLMLTVQGIKSGERFLGKSIPESVIANALSTLKLNSVNITLIGMPGCGKSTISREISTAYNRDLKDIDSLIVKKEGTDIPTIFREKGEGYFRDLETEICSSVCKEKGQVIATGGGAILRKENRDIIKANSVVVFIESDISTLETDGRPLSKDISTLKKMYEERLPLYEETADVKVNLCDMPTETANSIINAVKEF
ncbi:MAG: shikimate kinase, partial [Clostridia bacterium]|nr:shikimate kinase [Clostridia bacterium]